MAYRDIQPFSSVLGGTYEARRVPMNASETFEGGELIFVNVDGEAQTFPKDGTEALIADIGAGSLQVGVAVNGPGQAATAEIPTARAWIDPNTGNAYATGAGIHYWPSDQHNLFITRNVVAAGGAAAGAAPNGADRGVAFQITYVSGTTPDLGWGIERTAGVYGTDVVAKIVDVLDSRGNPVSATADGTFFVFEIQTAA